MASVADLKPDEIVAWVVTHAEEIRRRGKSLHGVRVTPETELYAFDGVVSLLVVTWQFSSRPYFSRAQAAADGVFYTFLTLLLGWWCIPWGPLLTIKALFLNLFGGRRIRVSKLLDAALGREEDTRVVVSLTPSAADLARERIVELGHPSGTAVCVARSRDDMHSFVVQYDDPEPSPHDFVSYQHGLMVLIDKRIAEWADGHVLDVEEGEFVFRGRPM